MASLARAAGVCRVAQLVGRCSLSRSVPQCPEKTPPRYQQLRKLMTQAQPAEQVPFFSGGSLSEVNKLGITIDNNLLRFGRVSSGQVSALLNAVEKQGNVLPQQSLLLLRCFGSVMFDEHPNVRTRLINDAWQKLEKLGAVFDVTHYNALLKVYLQNEMSFSPTEFLGNMEEKGITPNRVTYQNLIAQFCEEGDIKGASQILEYMKKEGLPITELVFNSLVTGHFRANDIESAEGILDIMRQARLDPSGDTYMAFLCGYAEKGDQEAMIQTFEKAEKDVALVRPQHLLRLIHTLAVNDHGNLVPLILDTLKMHTGYNQDAIKWINQLICKGFVDIAYSVYSVMPKPIQLSQQESSIGRFLLRAFAKNETSIDTVSMLMTDMKQKRISNDSLNIVIQFAYLYGKTDYALKLIEKLNSEGLPVRAHYFWPAICQYRDKGDREGCLKAVKLMKALVCSREGFGLTMHEYVVPSLTQQGMTADEIQNSLQEIGFHESEISFGYFIYLLETKGFKPALEYADGKTMTMVIAAVRPYLQQTYQKTQDWRSALQVLMLSQQLCDVRLRGMLRDMNGDIVIDAFNTQDWEAVEQMLDEMKNQKLYISDGVQNVIESFRAFGKIPASCLEKLKFVIDSEVSIRNVPRDTFSGMSQQELQSVIERTEDKAAKKWLLIRYCTNGIQIYVGRSAKEALRNEELVYDAPVDGELSKQFLQNVEKAEELKRSLDSEGFIYPAVILRQMAFMNSFYKKDLDQALGYIKEMQLQYPEYGQYTKALLSLVELMVEKGKGSEALQILERYAEVHKDILEGTFSDTYALEQQCVKVFEAAGRSDDPSITKHIMEAFFKLGYIKPATYVLLEAYIQEFINRGDKDGSIEATAEVVQKYKRAPKLDSLFKMFIKLEDPERLQRVVDIVTPVHGEMNILHQLMINFIECGHLKKAKKILETQGLRAVMKRLQSACEKFVDKGMISELEQLVNLSRDMFGVDRDEMLFQLIRGHVMMKNTEKAVDVLTQYEEESLQPSGRTLRYLAKVLQNSGMEVPFDVPNQVQTDIWSDLSNISLSPLQHQAVQCIEQQNFDGYLEIKRQAENSSSEKLSSSLLCQIAGYLLQARRLSDYRWLLRHLATDGDVESLLLIKMQFMGTADNTLKKCLFTAYAHSGQPQELLDYLEGHVREISAYVSEAGVKALCEKSPQFFKRFEQILYSAPWQSQQTALRCLWSYYFQKDPNSAEASAILQRNPGLLLNMRIVSVCQTAVKEERKDILYALIDLFRGKDKNCLAFAYSYLIGLYCKTEDLESCIDVVKNLPKDGITVQELRHQSVETLQQLLMKRNLPIPWKIALTEHGDGSSDLDSSSSDDEKR